MKVQVKVLDLCLGNEWLMLIYVIMGLVGLDFCVCVDVVIVIELG